MLRLLSERILQGLLVLLVVSGVAFALFQFVGDPVSQMLPPDATAADRAALTEDLRRVRHVRAATAGELAPVMRSKYVQGEVPREVYEAVEHDLRAGLPVLFSGVACQVAGLNGYLAARRVPVTSAGINSDIKTPGT